MASKDTHRGDVVAAADSAPAIESLRLPSFADPHCQFVSICGHIERPLTDGEIKRFDNDAQFGDGFWLHVVSERGSSTKKRKSGVHLHIDVKKRFKSASKKASSTMDALTSEVARFAGEVASCWIAAEFQVPVGDLPSGGVIQAFLGIATQAGKYRMEFQGASMSIDDPDLDELRWKLTDDGKSVLVSVDAHQQLTISRGYIAEAAEFLTGAFQRMVLDANKND